MFELMVGGYDYWEVCIWCFIWWDYSCRGELCVVIFVGEVIVEDNCLIGIFWGE